MAASDPIDILLQHDLWASKQMFATSEKLSPEQLNQKFEMGPGSVQATLAHILGAIRGWTDALNAKPPQPRPDSDGVQRSIAELSKLLGEYHAEFAAAIRSHPLSETITRTRAGKTATFTRGAVLVHVTTHGMHHRAQLLNMFRQLGVNPLPLSSVAEWTQT